MTCRRIWEAEAIEDGRLDDSSIASFDRHLRACADCSSAHAALTVLRETGRRLEPRQLSPFEHRRRRADLLRRANEEAVGPPRRRVELSFAVAAAVVLAAFVAVHVGHDDRVSGKGRVRAELRGPAFEVRPIGGAVFRDESLATAGRIVLSEGTLALHVAHLAPRQRFVVLLPDGELEVRGTRFIVEAGRGRTARVLVTEGVVALRIAGAPERTLAAGQSYTPGTVRLEERASPPGAASEVPAAALSAAPPSKRVWDSAGHAVSRNAPSSAPPAGNAPSAIATAEATHAERAPSPAEAAGEAFHTAMAAFSLGSYAEADERFAAFVGRFAEDSHCEDAAFLRTVIALRRGDPGAAVARGRSYRKRFPDGLRSKEIERMIETAERATTESRGERR